MDQNKVVAVLANDVSTNQEREAVPVIAPKEASPLKEFDLVVAVGGDGAAIW
jgi:hypothetical protein